MKVRPISELSKNELELLTMLQAKLDSKEWNQERFDQEYASCFPHADVIEEELRKLKLNYFVVT
jgi:hypothetical protein